MWLLKRGLRFGFGLGVADRLSVGKLRCARLKCNYSCHAHSSDRQRPRPQCCVDGERRRQETLFDSNDGCSLPTGCLGKGLEGLRVPASGRKATLANTFRDAGHCCFLGWLRISRWRSKFSAKTNNGCASFNERKAKGHGEGQGLKGEAAADGSFFFVGRCPAAGFFLLAFLAAAA